MENVLTPDVLKYLNTTSDVNETDLFFLKHFLRLKQDCGWKDLIIRRNLTKLKKRLNERFSHIEKKIVYIITIPVREEKKF